MLNRPPIPESMKRKVRQEAAIKQALGHSSIATTLEYADVTEAATKSSHKRCVI